MKGSSKYAKSRTEHSARNTVVAITARILAILSGFFVRVIFTHTLSQEYVGINGLFTDIISILALSELGIGTAITFALYKPIADEDIEKQKSIMALYKKFYFAVACIVLAAGLLLIPFMNLLIKDHENIEHLILIYLLYLLSSFLSYFLIYKKTLVDAHQLGYIGVLYHTIFLLIQYFGQAFILIFTRNFILYLVLFILCTIGNNIMISIKADKLYPYLKDKNVKPLDGEEKGKIFENIRAMLLHKIGNVLVNNTDNLLLSSLIGSIVVGCYSNYFLIIGSVRQVLEQIFQGIAASVGNLGVTENKDRIKKIFLSTFFLDQWVYGAVSVVMYEVLDFFVGKSFGDSYVFEKSITLVLCINFYLLGIRQATIVFRDSMGLFKYDKYKAIAEAVINLAVSIVLGKLYGVIGIFLGTLISMTVTSLWIEPFIFYKYKLKESSLPYFGKLLLYMAVTAGLWWGEDYICHLLPEGTWLMWVARILVCLLISNVVYLILYGRTKEFILLKKKALSLLQKKTKSKDSNVLLTQEEKMTLTLLKNSLRKEETKDPGDVDYKKVFAICRAHNITSLVGEQFMRLNREQILNQEVDRQIEITTLQNYRLLFLCRNLCDQLIQKDIAVAVLKGASAGYYYPEPELRKSGDIDLLLLSPEEESKATEILVGCGLVIKEEQESNHHIIFETKDGIEVELHVMLAEPFDNKYINGFNDNVVSQCKEHIVTKNIMGVELPVLCDGYQAYELLLHMLQHFLRAGFGLKLLCDWVTFWNSNISERDVEIYLNLVSNAGIKGFSDMVTEGCIQYLGLETKYSELLNTGNVNCDAFMREIMDAEEFGKSDINRMVALRGDSILDYMREFHHQMHLQFKFAGNIFLLWPVLWIITFFRFLRNNKVIRNTSFWGVMSNAGYRGKLIKKMKLFRR